MKKSTNSMMDPKYLLLDFEQALSDGFKDIFPNVIIARDRFYFTQANVKRLNELGLQNVVSEVSQDLSVLWERPSKEDFNAHLITFLNKWDRRASQYSEGYFCPTWLSQYPPHKWASYGRSKDTPSGKVTLFLSSLANY
jgi:hypothetical protein